jgi:hypothetical protein
MSSTSPAVVLYDGYGNPVTVVGGKLVIDNGSWIGSTAPTVGQKTSINSIPVTIASDQSALPFTNTKAATATISRVASSASSVQLLAANTNRLGVVVVNDSSQTLYLKFGTTASATDYTYKIRSQTTIEVIFSSFVYTGRIDGIWAAANGAAQITEVSP